MIRFARTARRSTSRDRRLKATVAMTDRASWMVVDPSAGSGGGPSLADYRVFVGPPDKYDVVAALQFTVLTQLGLRERHRLLDVGCGSLRAGRLFMPYLSPGRYFGIEPEQWLVEEGIKHELGQDLIRLKRPVFSNDASFTLTAFGQSFDFVLAHSVFSHAAESQIRHCLAEAEHVLTTEGTLVATFFEGRTSYAGTGWQYPDPVAYRWDDLARFVADAGLVVQRLRYEHPNHQAWVAIVRPGHESQIPTSLLA
ncbi:MAG: methyltransferase domain-containing protein [Luteitalea sp.]|nr:methyltransferase domain-containing protein [Luteitalea sp.]